MKKIEVVGAIIIENKKLLSAKRGSAKNPEVAYKYEFVGGKVEANESKEDAIIREVFEEMDMQIEVISPFLTVVHCYELYEVTLHTFLCKRKSNYRVKEHESADWFSADELIFDDWAPADEPILKALIEQKLI